MSKEHTTLNSETSIATKRVAKILVRDRYREAFGYVVA